MLSRTSILINSININGKKYAYGNIFISKLGDEMQFSKIIKIYEIKGQVSFMLLI